MDFNNHREPMVPVTEQWKIVRDTIAETWADEELTPTEKMGMSLAAISILINKDIVEFYGEMPEQEDIYQITMTACMRVLQETRLIDTHGIVFESFTEIAFLPPEITDHETYLSTSAVWIKVVLYDKGVSYEYYLDPVMGYYRTTTTASEIYLDKVPPAPWKLIS